MNGSIIALSITSEDIKLIEISQENGETVLGAMRHHTWEGGGPTDPTAVLREIIQEEKPKTLKTLLVMNSQDLNYKNFSFPFSSSKKVSKAIHFEIDSAFSSEKHIVTHIESIPKEPGKKAFMAAIVPRELLARRIRESEEAGLRIVGITSDVSTLGQYVRSENEALVMEMGERETLFALYAHGVPVLTRNIPIGIRQILGDSPVPDPERLKPLVGEIKRTIHSFRAKTGIDFKRIYVSGSICYHRQVFEVFQGALGLEFIDQNPEFPVFRKNGGEKDLSAYASLLGAMGWNRKNRSFDFYRDELLRTQPAAIQKTYLRWGVVVLLSLLVTAALSLWVNITLLDKRRDFLNAEMRKTFQTVFPQTKRIVDEVRQARNALDAKRSAGGEGEASLGPSILDTLAIISGTISADTDFEIRSFFWEKGKIEINGKTDSFKTVNRIQQLLSERGEFSQVTISNAKSENEGNDVVFTLTVHLAG